MGMAHVKFFDTDRSLARLQMAISIYSSLLKTYNYVPIYIGSW